jgi:hypothetical protein
LAPFWIIAEEMNVALVGPLLEFTEKQSFAEPRNCHSAPFKFWLW